MDRKYCLWRCSHWFFSPHPPKKIQLERILWGFCFIINKMPQKKTRCIWMLLMEVRGGGAEGCTNMWNLLGNQIEWLLHSQCEAAETFRNCCCCVFHNKWSKPHKYAAFTKSLWVFDKYGCWAVRKTWRNVMCNSWHFIPKSQLWSRSVTDGDYWRVWWFPNLFWHKCITLYSRDIKLKCTMLQKCKTN